ncbi:MAG: hypothetical protein HW375_4 [Anaerolineales bacterium]|nr:hypothetical protein [Anaerolineales bacterium]
MADNDLETIIQRSRQELLGFIDIQEPNAEDYKRARTIQGIYASATRELQTRGAQEATRYAMATDFLTADERAEYVRLALPDHAANVIRAGRKDLAGASS